MGTMHADFRMTNRLIASGIDRDTVLDIVGIADAFAGKCAPFESVALKLRSIPMVGNAWSDVSNGDCIVAIIRGRIVQTYMFRRNRQPFTAAALNVERTVTL